jgi:hypothetical protein
LFNVARASGGRLGASCALVLLASCAHKPAPTADAQFQTDIAYSQAQVRKVVKDPQRADRVAGLAGEFEKLVFDRAAGTKAYGARLATMSSNYSATRADFEALAAEEERARSFFLERAIAVRQQVASLTTDAEWEELKKARMRDLEEASRGSP